MCPTAELQRRLCPPQPLHPHFPYAAAVLPTFIQALLLSSGMLPAERGPGPLSHELQDAAQPFSQQPRPGTGRNRGSVLPAPVGGSGELGRGPGLHRGALEGSGKGRLSDSPSQSNPIPVLGEQFLTEP